LNSSSSGQAATEPPPLPEGPSTQDEHAAQKRPGGPRLDKEPAAKRVKTRTPPGFQDSESMVNSTDTGKTSLKPLNMTADIREKTHDTQNKTNKFASANRTKAGLMANWNKSGPYMSSLR